ncbi:MAG: GTPase Era [Acidobacteriota bacterium]
MVETPETGDDSLATRAPEADKSNSPQGVTPTEKPKIQVGPDYRTGFAALIGRPNAGKSTLLNTLVGEHIAAVSAKPQTTRTRILGIINRPAGQLIFVDTPGIHKPGYALNRRMMGIVSEAISVVDVILLMRDATSAPGSGDRFALELIRNSGKPAFLLLNKIDLLRDKRELLPMIDHYQGEHTFAEIIPISARTADGQELLIDKLIEFLPKAEPLYESDLFTDQPERSIVAELVREQILALTGEELPFATAVRTESWREEPDATEIHCVIYVERESQKPIVIGRGGAKLKEVGTKARRAIENLIARHVRLHLFVRVQPNWRNDERTLDELGIEQRQ